jgi:hypothetical protein
VLHNITTASGPEAAIYKGQQPGFASKKEFIRIFRRNKVVFLLPLLAHEFVLMQNASAPPSYRIQP